MSFRPLAATPSCDEASNLLLIEGGPAATVVRLTMGKANIQMQLLMASPGYGTEAMDNPDTVATLEYSVYTGPMLESYATVGAGASSMRN